MKRFNIFFTILLTIFLNGCIAIPLPSEKHQFTKTMEQQIEVGKTSRDEIIKSLGAPELESSHTHLIYRLPRETMKLLILAGGMGGGAVGLMPIGRSDYVLLMTFDEAGILRQSEALVYKDNTYDTVRYPSALPIPETKRQKIFSIKKIESDFFFSPASAPIAMTKLAFSPDGKSILVLGKEKERLVHSIYRIDLDTNQSHLLQENVQGLPRFSPDLSIVTLRQGTSMTLKETNTSALIFEKDKGFWGLTVFTGAVFNADGSRIAASDNYGGVSIFDTLNGNEIVRFQHEKEPWIESIAYSKNGQWIAVTTKDNQLTLWDAKTGLLLDSQRAASGPIEFSPDNTALAINSKDHVQLWKLRSSNKTSLELFDIFTLPGQLWDNGPKLSDYSIAFSPDSRHIAARNGSLVVYDIQKQRKIVQDIKTLDNTTTYDSVHCITFSPDGSSVIGGTSSGIFSWKLSP